MLPETRAAAARPTLPQDVLTMAPGCFDVLSARIAEDAGFTAAYLTPFGILATKAGEPPRDGRFWADLVQLVGRLASTTRLALVADGHTGLEGALPVERVVAELAAAGAAAVVIEDRNSYWEPGPALLELQAMAAKIKAARRAANGMALIARTDAAKSSGLEDAIRRCRAYLDAGADMVMPLMTPYMDYANATITHEDRLEVHRRLVAEVGGPLVTHSPFGLDITPSEAAELGYVVYVVPQLLVSAAAAAMRSGAAALASDEVAERMKAVPTIDSRDLSRLAGTLEWLERRW